MKKKTRKLKKCLQGFALFTALSPWIVSHGAQQEFLNGNLDHYTALLKKFSLTQPTSPPKGLQLPRALSSQQNNANAFQFRGGALDSAGTSHVRYDQYYRDLPVWGTQVIYHLSKTNASITGSPITGIPQDVPDLNAKISFEEAQKIAFGKNPRTKRMAIQKIIYFDKNTSTKASLAYHVSYLSQTPSGPAIPSFIIDANTGKILSEWDALPRMGLGQGPGGVAGPQQYEYNYDIAHMPPGSKALGSFDSHFLGDGTCAISNNLVRIINLENKAISSLPFSLPVSLENETKYSLSGYRYICFYPEYVNPNDNGFAPINSGLSPVNDAAYFVQTGIDMLATHYKVQNPVGAYLPVRVFTHIGDYEDSFACGESCMNDLSTISTIQLGFGNGGAKLYPLTSGDNVAHELGHLFTQTWAQLNKTEEARAISESFSDITAMAFNYYLSNTLGFTWYWDGKDWGIGARMSKDNKPLRSLDHPKVAHVSDFKPGMDCHLASGIYSKAFYLLSKTSGWTVEKAYEVILLANMFDWMPDTNFNTGVCGVIAAAKNKKYSEADVIAAFQQVGAACPPKPKS